MAKNSNKEPEKIYTDEKDPQGQTGFGEWLAALAKKDEKAKADAAKKMEDAKK